MPYGAQRNAEMIRTFCTELHEQGILPGPVDPGVLFPDPALAAPPTRHEALPAR